MIICNNYDCSDYFDEAREHLTMFEENVSDDDIYNTAQAFANDTVDSCLQCLEKYLKAHPLLVTGSVGCWDGTYEGGKVIENSRELWKLFDGCDFYKIEDIKRHLYIECSHHDGTNYYEIRELTNKGYKFYQNYGWDMSRRELCEYLKYNFNSRLPKIEWCL